MLEIPSMRERTIKIGSAGKIFSLTGWKVGLVVAAPDLMKVISKSHQFLTFTTPPNLQTAVAYGLGKDEAYFAGMRAMYQRSRDRFSAGLAECGFPVLPSEATYFVNVDLASIGETDEIGWKAARDPASVHDLHATILHLLGLDHKRLTFRSAGRDFRLTDVAGNVVKGVLA